MEADNCPFTETLCTSCQNHSIGLSELMLLPSLKILHISTCVQQEKMTTTVVPKLLYSTSQNINCNSDQLNLFIEFMLANVGIPFVLPLSVPQVLSPESSISREKRRKYVKRCRESIKIYGDVGCYSIFTVICTGRDA